LKGAGVALVLVAIAFVYSSYRWEHPDETLSAAENFAARLAQWSVITAVAVLTGALIGRQISKPRHPRQSREASRTVG
jgi:hypothetical protein